MKTTTGFAMLGLVLASAGCATSGGYQGAEAEAAYNKNLDAQRLVAVINNDDYYEIRKDNRIIVLSDADDVKLWLATGDIPLRVTRIGGGPKGETLVFGIAKPESKKKDGFGSVEMYEGRRAGADKNFYAEVLSDNKWYVFGTWAELDSFRKTGRAEGLASAGWSALGEPVVVAQPADALAARFRSLHGAGAAPVAATVAPAAPAPAGAKAGVAKAKKKK
jgi:hypothetical protein